MLKKNLAVLFGGKSCEHDVSVITGLQTLHNADPSLYNLVPIYIAHDGLWYTGEALREAKFFEDFKPLQATQCLLVRAEKGGSLIVWPPQKKGLFAGAKQEEIAHIDVALPCFHGMNGEDGTIQGLLELLDIPYTSAGVLGSAVSMDKIAQKAMLRGCGIPVLPMCWFDRSEWEASQEKTLERIEAELAYPLFVKPANLGSSIGISKADNRMELANAIEIAVEFDRRILVETGLAKPMEINCSGLGYAQKVEASVCEMPVSWQEFLTFDDKYLRGGKGQKQKLGSKGDNGGMANLQRQIPAPIGAKMTAIVQQMTIDIFKILDLKGVVRIDFMIDQPTGTLYVNEVNTIPGSLAYYLWEPKGLIYARLIDRLVACALEASEHKSQSKFTYDSKVLKGFSGTKG